MQDPRPAKALYHYAAVGGRNNHNDSPTQWNNTRSDGLLLCQTKGAQLTSSCRPQRRQSLPRMPRLRLRLAPPTQTHDSAPTGSSATPHRLWEPQSRGDGALWSSLRRDPAGDRVGRQMNKTGNGPPCLEPHFSCYCNLNCGFLHQITAEISF